MNLLVLKCNTIVMNAKVYTPKNLKMGSTMKQFLLSLVATTISIVLTFGTAAWLDGKKKEEAKREMVMMILYDLAGSIEQAEQCDSQLREGFKQQVAVAENPKLLDENPFLFVKSAPYVNYTETVERIFSTNIETINTLGNVLFAENVSDIYRLRQRYRQEICDKYMADFEQNEGFKQYEQVMNIAYSSYYIYMSGILLSEMKEEFAQCRQMMDVSDADLATYRQKRQAMLQASAADSIQNALLEEAGQNHQQLEEAKEKGKKSASK